MLMIWVLVDCFLFHHIKPKKKAKNKTKAGKSETQNIKSTGSEDHGTGHYRCASCCYSHWQRCGSVTRRWDCWKSITFKRPLSMEYAAWLRVILLPVLLFIFIQMAPAFTFLYTLKLVALLNLGVQTMKLSRGL